MLRRLHVIGLIVATGCTVQQVRPERSLALERSAQMSAAGLRTPAATSLVASQQGTAGLPPSAITADARLKSSPRHAEWVKIAWEPGSADSLMAWIVYPSSRSKAPVVVVVHEIFGLSAWVRSVADQVAAEGFIAVAPDFLSRLRGAPSSVELSVDSAMGMIRGVNAAERNRAIVAAANWAMMQPGAEQRYAVIGFCWGGSTTFIHAVHGGVKGFSGAVAFYGLPYFSGGTPANSASPATPAMINGDSLRKITVPVMLFNGSRDARIAAAMPALDSMMKALDKNYSGTNYEGAVHGFVRAQNDPKPHRDEAEEAANLAATKDAWPKTVAFLKRNLGVK